ncbi:ABC transporter substrate-binding protein [Azospirillum sp. SYSU D00513]|uniref:ABC transporter substrate-binding protein n=1 Tax=Azospirillum sp. SYSU D00513 TaxID=2812561 RepID=UPI001FFF9EFD|nr:ABC transporter substrate-binding protein [Azospirillum sp. SYSU D00513]
MRALKSVAIGAVMSAMAAGGAWAADPVKIGLILPMSGPFASTGKQIDAAVKLYQQLNGTTVGGREIQLILKDDTGTAPETTKRLAQELVVKEKVSVLAGFGLTPLALAAAPISEQAKVPMIVMAAASSVITTKSPYIVRTAGTLPQSAATIADWAAKNGAKKMYSMVTDYGPGIDAETTFKKRFGEAGGTLAGEVRIPLKNPDYGPFIQRAKDSAPDALFAFVPSGEGASFMKEFNERGLGAAGVRLLVTGDVTDDDLLPAMGDAALGAVSAHYYSAAHPSPENQAYVEAFKKANNGMRPNFMSVGGWDGLHLVYEVLKKTGGKIDGPSFIEAAKGMSWTSPRGPMSIDPETRDVVQDIYIRKVERVNGELYNVEFDSVKAVKDPGKAG